MRYVRVNQSWLIVHAYRGSVSASYGITATAPIVSFQRAEAVTGLLVGAGSIAVAVPGTVARMPPTSAFLLLPIAALLAYGVLILARRPGPDEDAATPLRPAERRRVRRRTIGWATVTLLASMLPPEWIWPLFISGWITLAYAIRQIQRHRGS